MTLPKKKSRKIQVDGKEYRWLISKRKETIELSIERTEISGQLMQVSFESHNSYKKDANLQWQRVRQDTSITPQIVKQIIQHGLANGWKPEERRKPLFYLSIWQAERFISELPELSDEELRLRDLAWEEVNNLRYEFSLDSKWRKQLFEASNSHRFLLPEDYLGLSQQARDCGLQIAVFNDGWTESGFIVFGIESVDFPEPDIVTYTFNNPDII
jgi:hypothetical protein